METKTITKETTVVSGKEISKGWTAEQEKVIASFQEKQGMSRNEAVKAMRKAEQTANTVTVKQLGEQTKALDAGINKKLTGKAKTVAKSAPKVKVARAPKSTETTNHKPTPAMRKRIDESIRATIGKNVAVEGRLGVRNTDGPTGAPYERYMLSNGHTCFVSGWHRGEPVVSVSEKPAVKSSYTVSRFLKAMAKREKRAAEAGRAEAK